MKACHWAVVLRLSKLVMSCWVGYQVAASMENSLQIRITQSTTKCSEYVAHQAQAARLGLLSVALAS